jgi:hypothetical protein
MPKKIIKDVMLWGLKKASKQQINKFLNVEEEPEEKKEEPKEDKKQTPKKTEFIEGEDYNIEDIEMLEAEDDKLEELIEKLYDEGKDDEAEELEDKQDKIRKLLEGLYAYKKISGGKMTSRARVVKGSEEAKAVGQRLAEARRAKKALKDAEKPKVVEEPKKKKIKGKPYYFIGEIPKGFREATEEEAIRNGKVGELGLYEVDKIRYDMYKDYKILLSIYDDDGSLKTIKDIQIVLSGLKSRLMRILKKLETERLHKDAGKDNDFEELNEERKKVQAGWNWYYKYYCEKKGIEYKKQIFKYKEPEIKKTEAIIPEYKPVIKIDPRTGKPVDEPFIEEDEYYYFEGNDDKFKLKKKYFDKDIKLKPKYAKQLFEKKIILMPEHYTDEDVEKYFNKMVKKGKGIFTMENLTKAFSGFNPLRLVQGAFHASTYGRGDRYAPYVREIIKKYGEKKINKIQISRAPIMKSISSLLNILTKGVLKQRMDKFGYDDLFHLKLLVYLEDGTKIGIEKNEKINMTVNEKPKDGEEYKDVYPFKQDITLNDLLEGAENIQGEKYHQYSGHSNNCQDFVMALLKGSNIGDDDDYRFVKQDVASLFEEYDFVKKIQDFTTDVAGKLSEIVYGSGIVKRKPDLNTNEILQTVLFNKEDWNKRQAKKWLKDNGLYYDSVDDTKEHYRYRQYNPEDLNIGVPRHYITKPIDYKDKTILLVISMRNPMSGSGYKVKVPKGGKISLSKITKGITKGVSKATTPLNKATQALQMANPLHYITGTKGGQKFGMTTGDIAANYALPAVIEAGKPLYLGAAGTAGMMVGGPVGALIATEAAKELYDSRAKPYEPKQKSKALGAFSKEFGKAGSKAIGFGAKVIKKAVRGRGRPKKYVEDVDELRQVDNPSLRQFLKGREKAIEKEEKEYKRAKSSGWIEHVKAYAKEHNVSYKQAMKEAKATYRR